MYRVVVVEDERIQRAGLIHSVNWLSLNCMIVGEAENGKSGLELILRERPDIVIADISMPLMNGLDMIAEALREYMFFSILLTSYSEFEYAQQAVSLHVYAYLLKPVNDQLLENTLKTLTEEIERERRLEKVLKQSGSGDGHIEPYRQIHTPQSTDNYYVKKALEEIHRSYVQRLSVEWVAEHLGVSASYLSRKFKSVTNRSFLDYLNQYRVIQAIQLMGSGQYRFGEIADMTGFSSEKHFYTVFRKYTQMTPSEFVKERGSIVTTTEPANDRNE